MSDFRNFNQDYLSYDTRVSRLKIKKARKGRIFMMAVSLLAVLGAILYGALVYADDAWVYLANKYFGSRINAVSGSEIPRDGESPWLNVMLAGVDQRNNEPSRSDTLMVAMLNLKEKTVQIISIPRDTRVKIEGVKYKTRINHSHSLGGVELTRKTVEQLLGIPIHNYVETNFDGFKNIIDDLGGVSVDVEKRMYYPSEGINLKKGLQHLGGKDALSYVRFRSDGGGDLPRIQRQHKFLRALTEQVLQPKTLLKLPKIAGELHDNINTDMSVKDLIVLAGEFKNVKPENVRFADIPGMPKYVNGASYYVIDEEQLKTFIDAILEGKDPKEVPMKDEELVKQRETESDKKITKESSSSNKRNTNKDDNKSSTKGSGKQTKSNLDKSSENDTEKSTENSTRESSENSSKNGSENSSENSSDSSSENKTGNSSEDRTGSSTDRLEERNTEPDRENESESSDEVSGSVLENR